MNRMPLATLLPDVPAIPAGLEISGLVQDSRTVGPGDAFVAIEGFGAHGLNFIAQAERAGAAVVLFEPPMPDAFAAAADVAGIPVLAVPSLRARLGALADRFHEAPSQAMTVVGVTGTNGKTSTVQLIAQAWTLQGRTAGTIGTLGAGLYGRVEPTGFTTPLVLQTHALLAGLRDAGADAVAMEVSSHALDQGRVARVHQSHPRSSRPGGASTACASTACASRSPCSPISPAIISTTTARWTPTARPRRSCSRGRVSARR